MNEFEQQLRQALVRKPAPSDFAARVQSRIPAPRRAPWQAWAAAMAAMLVVTVGGLRYHEWRQAVEAKQQLLRALAITEEKLALVERKLNQGRNQ